ncbi:MAG: hypothetical protein BGO78_11045 [Chloroflexi bacterium 44-23]|nr:MAG: hypothetical protein BGO78_11045 [Chloroflexi bacterium 44-23]
MSELFDTLKSFFFNDEWFYIEVDDRPLLRLNHWGENGRFSCQAEINENQKIFYFYSYFPVNVPPEKRSQIAELITRINYGMRVGNFELDYEDGEVRFKTSIDVENVDLSQALVSNHVYANVWTMDRYLSALFAVIYGNISPQEAADQIEE